MHCHHRTVGPPVERHFRKSWVLINHVWLETSGDRWVHLWPIVSDTTPEPDLALIVMSSFHFHDLPPGGNRSSTNGTIAFHNRFGLSSKLERSRTPLLPTNLL